MKIHGERPSANVTRPLVVPRPDGSEWVLRISPLPLGFQRRLRERGIAPPVPPTRVARDAAGHPLKDRAGLAVVLADERDAEFLAEKERVQQHLAVLIVREALRHDPEVEFETSPPAEGSWVPYADALCRELEEAGWSLGDLGFVCEAICRMSNLLDGDLREAEQVFSRPARERVTDGRLRIHDPSSI